MKKNIFGAIIALSISFAVTLPSNAELKGNKTNVHVSNYGDKNKKVKIAAGLAAPMFSAMDSKGKKVRLSDFKNKSNVLLVFYPGDATPTCTQQLNDIRDNYKGLEKINVKVFGVNPADAVSHNTFIKDQKYPFQLIIDQNHKISDMYDSMNFMGFIERTVVLINKKGKIVLFERGLPDVSPNKISKYL